MNALAQVAEEGRNWRRYSSGRSQYPFDPMVSEWGNPASFIAGYLVVKVPTLLGYSRKRGDPGNRNIQVPGGKENECPAFGGVNIPLVAVSESGTAQTTFMRKH